MPEALPRPEVPAESVRTLPDSLLVVSLCPVCEVNGLRGRQTVCSAACRRERSRQRQESALRAEVLALRAQADALLAKVDARSGQRRRRRKGP
jgi:predicted nucleic acid-binding Zn ribbon protein